MRRKVYSILAVFNKETLLKIIFNLRSRVDFKIEAHFKFEAQLSSIRYGNRNMI